MNDSNTMDEVKDEEHLARLLDQKSKFSANRVKHFAFHPPKNTSTTSVFRCDHCSNDDLLEIARQQKIKVKAIADVIVKDVLKSGHIYSLNLSVVSDTSNRQHPKHAHIVFPFKNTEEYSHKIKYICMEIAKYANLVKDINNSILFLE